MKEEEIKKLGYEAVAGNLYKKDDTLYIQQDGKIKKASELTEQQLKAVTSMTAYEGEMKKLGKEKPKEEKKEKAIDKDTSKGELVSIGGVPATMKPMSIVTPQVDVKKAIESFKLFQDLKAKLLSADDYLYIGKDGKPTKKGVNTMEYIKRSGWRKLATVFNLNCQILSKERNVYEDPEGLYYIWTYFVRVTAPNGRFQDAEGSATSRDPFFTKGGKQPAEEKNIMLKSQTVGFNRAISDLIGGGGKTAEEVE